MRSLLAGASGVLLAALAAGPAAADMTVYYHVGSWDAFSGSDADGKLVCGVGSTNPTDNRSFSIRFVIGGSSALFEVKKPSWNIPANSQVPVVVQVGLDSPWNLQAGGNGQSIQWQLDSAAMQGFDIQFRRASQMTVSFPSGNEAPWTLGLNGSTAISNAFGRCVTDMTRRAGAVQAQPAGPTQPFVPASGQPAAPAAPGQPTQPTSPQ